MPLSVAVPTVTEPDRLLWVHGNHMGVPTVITDATGTEHSFPTAYALPGFPGQSRTLSDLYYNRYRDYDPTIGRYIQADPIGLEGGVNPYSYAMNNPLRYTDPTGENTVAVRGAVGVGRAAGWGLSLWCRNNIALCMKTIGPAAIRVANACKAVSNALGGGGGGPKCSKASSWDLKNAGITDAHAYKEDILGTKKGLSAWDICKCKDGIFRLAPVGTCSTSKIFQE